MISLTFFRKMAIKYKLIIALMITTIPMTLLMSFVSYTYLKRSYQNVTEKELKNVSESLARMIETATSVSIQNYLRAVAEKNLEIIEGYYTEYQEGRIKKEKMIESIRFLFSRQSVGKSGYIYCINSEGVAIIHPNPAVQDESLVQFPFILDQIKRKNGYLEYEWKNPEDKAPRHKSLYMVYFEPLDWIISISAYHDEFDNLISLSEIEELISAFRLGEAGYAFIVNRNGELLIHPEKGKVKNISDVVLHKETVINTIRDKNKGQMHYYHIDPATKIQSPQLAYFEYIVDYGWYMFVSYPESEVYRPFRTIRSLIIVTTLLILIITVAVATWFSAYANLHIRKLINAFEQGARGNFKARLQTSAKDEFGRLSIYFNSFMEQLENYQQSLFEEIEKSRNMQHAIAESERRLKTIVQNAPVLIWAIDTDGVLIFYEGALPEKNTEIAIGRPLKDLWMHWEGVSHHIDLALQGQSGTLLIDKPEYAFEIHYTPLLNDTRVVGGAVGVAIDVTPRRRAERKLSEVEQSHLKLAMAVEQAAEIIVITDTSGIIEYVNPAFEKSSGYTRAEAMGRKPGVLKSGKHGEAFYQDLWQTISSGRIWTGRFVNKKKDGTLFYEDASISPLRDMNGKIVNYVASKRDVTQEIILHNQLLHSQRMKAIGTLAGGIAHDFNNILSGILGYTEICLDEVPKSGTLFTRLEKIMKAGQRAKELIGHIQTFSRQSSTEPIRMLPGPVVSEAVKLVKASYPTISFDLRIAKTDAINAVPSQIHQIVMNLCTNACHAMQADGGRITVILENKYFDSESARYILDVSAGDYVELTVTDTGHGIPKEIQAKIFDPYFTTKAEGDGSGLGLSVVHGIVKRMDGAIKVYSEPGTGTTVTTYLPAFSEAGIQEPRKKSDLPMGNEESVLLVDDDFHVLESTQQILESLNYKVTAVSSAVDALDLYRKQPDNFNIIITDFLLPKMNGAQFAEAVRQDKSTIPVIIATGFSYDERLEKVKKQRTAELINKPIIRMELARKIASVLHNRSAIT